MKPIYFIACLQVISLVSFNEKNTENPEKSVAGKIYFSSKPFTSDNSGSKKSFSSSEFIYGRLELSGQTIKEAFKIRDRDEEEPYAYLMCKLMIFKDGEQQGFGSFNESYLLLKRDDLQRSWLNFDVLPEPSKTTTLFSITKNFSEGGLVAAPLYKDINPSQFPESGKYTVRIEIYYEVKDAWGNAADRDKWPRLVGEYEFAFNDSDVTGLIKNREAVTKLIRENDFRNVNLLSWASTSTGPEKKISGTINFSDKPFAAGNSGGKTNFTSNEFIYSRLQLSGSSIKEAFKLGETTKQQPYHFLVCDIEVLKNGQPVGYHKSKNNHILLSKEDLDKTWLNLDILPDPAKASTLYSMLDDFSAGYGYIPLYSMINPDYFPSGGKYRLNVRIFFKTRDAWDRQEDEDKWPFVEDGFDFTLREADIAALKKNHQASRDVMNANAFRYDKLPDVFSKPMKVTDPKATTAKIAAILKRDLPNRTILKWVVEPYSGSLWSIAKDDFNLPKYRYFNPHVWVAYKEGDRCYVGHVTLRETYSGGGTYGPLEVGFTTASSSGGDRGIDCSKIK
jgi:hypothetical protein